MQQYEITVWPARESGNVDFGVYFKLPDGRWRGVEDLCVPGSLPEMIGKSFAHVRDGGGGVFKTEDGKRVFSRA